MVALVLVTLSLLGPPCDKAKLVHYPLDELRKLVHGNTDASAPWAQQPVVWTAALARLHLEPPRRLAREARAPELIRVELREVSLWNGARADLLVEFDFLQAHEMPKADSRTPSRAAWSTRVQLLRFLGEGNWCAESDVLSVSESVKVPLQVVPQRQTKDPAESPDATVHVNAAGLPAPPSMQGADDFNAVVRGESWPRRTYSIDWPAGNREALMVVDDSGPVFDQAEDAQSMAVLARATIYLPVEGGLRRALRFKLNEPHPGGGLLFRTVSVAAGDAALLVIKALVRRAPWTRRPWDGPADEPLPSVCYRWSGAAAVKVSCPKVLH